MRRLKTVAIRCDFPECNFLFAAGILPSTAPRQQQMGDKQGFDDRFNDGLFAASLHNSKKGRPKQWPKSVSEMRGHTSYENQGMSTGDHDTGYSNHMGRRPYLAQSQLGQHDKRAPAPAQKQAPVSDTDGQDIDYSDFITRRIPSPTYTGRSSNYGGRRTPGPWVWNM